MPRQSNMSIFRPTILNTLHDAGDEKSQIFAAGTGIQESEVENETKIDFLMKLLNQCRTGKNSDHKFVEIQNAAV